MYKALFLLPCAAAALLPLSSGAAPDKGKAPRPVNLPFNTTAEEDDPHLAEGGLTLFYTTRKGGKDDIYAAQRRSALAAWPKKGRVIDDSYVPSKGDDRSTFATEGRYPRFLYFATKRDEKNTNFDLFVAIKHGANKVWSAPTPVMNVNTDEDELYPWLTASGKELYFSRKTKDGWRVFVAKRAGSTGPGGWQEPALVDLPANFYHATLTPSGKTMYLQGPLGKGRTGLFVSTRAAKGWDKPEPLESLNDPEGKTGDRSPNLSRRGDVLYFASDRPGGKGGLDVWSVPTAQLQKK
jgi:hypothetical protein